MRAQVTLTPTESKKLIAKAVVQMAEVRRAREGGLVVLHPSSSTYFVVEELTGRAPGTDIWVCGVIVPKGACLEAAPASRAPGLAGKPPEEFTHSWVVKDGALTTGLSLKDIFEQMGPGDVYVKGVNALDSEGTVGILIGSLVEGGTIGRVLAASRRKGFPIVFPVGLEKLIPIPVKEAAREARKNQCDYAMGIACGLLPCRGLAVTEVKAIEILSGATATPIAAGGLAGAEGSVLLAIRGEKEQVSRAIEFVEQCKGAQLPQARTLKCEVCGAPLCNFPVKNKPWA